MKKTTVLFCSFLLGVPLLSADAQSKRKNSTSDDFGSSIGHEIDKIVDNMTNRWEAWNLDNQNAEEDTIIRKAPASSENIDEESESKARTFSGDKVIEESETIVGNVVVKGGDLTIYGKVDGDVLVVGGDIRVKKTGRVTGNARVINGSIRKEKGAVVEGYEDKANEEKSSYRESRRRFSRSGHSFDVPWADEETNLDNFIFRFNRVESLFLGLSTPKKFYWDGERNWNAYGSLGWGFKSHTWRGNLGLSRQFAILSNEGNGIIELGAEGYSLTDTKDQWIISLHENTAAALFLHEDFRDYFERQGYAVHVAYYTKHDYLKSELKVLYLADSYDTLANKIDWAFFGGDKQFRANPLIDPRKMRSIMVNAGVSTISKTSDGPEGWSLFGSTEFARKTSGGEFEFDQYLINLCRFQPLGRYDNLNIRVRVGSADGTLPPQKMYELGGLGTIDALPFKSEAGNRMVLINAEFILNGSFLDDLDFWPTWFFRNFNFLLTSDAGFTRMALPSAAMTEGFESVKWNDFKNSVGVALANRSGSFRIGLAWRTDYPAPAQFVLRFNRPF